MGHTLGRSAHSDAKLRWIKADGWGDRTNRSGSNMHCWSDVELHLPLRAKRDWGVPGSANRSSLTVGRASLPFGCYSPTIITRTSSLEDVTSDR